MASEKRITTFVTSEDITIKTRRWSTEKFFLLFDKFQEISELLAEIGADIARVRKGKEDENDDDPETIKEFIRIIFSVIEKAHMRLDFIILESVFQEPDDFSPGELLPEDYMGLLAHVIETNITVHAVKNFKRLLGSFTKAQSNLSIA